MKITIDFTTNLFLPNRNPLSHIIFGAFEINPPHFILNLVRKFICVLQEWTMIPSIQVNNLSKAEVFDVWFFSISNPSTYKKNVDSLHLNVSLFYKASPRYLYLAQKKEKSPRYLLTIIINFKEVC